MAKLTRANVAYDLTISPHIEVVKYEGCTIKYVFSSQTYRIKFLGRSGEHRRKINESLSNRFGFKIENDILSDIKLYSSIEKRGFLIKHNGVAIECLNDIILDGKTLIIKN